MLDYSVPSLQFLIGNFDASQYLDSISLSVPMYEPEQALLWSGRFKVSNNLKARASGLTDADFSEYSSPVRWRPYQQPVRLNIKGFPSPVFRIENYRYNLQTNSGQGILTQIPTAVAGDRPGIPIETTMSGNIGGAIDKLLTAAFMGATVLPNHALAGDGGVLDVPLTTRNPWADACRLAGINWTWLGVDGSESIVTINGADNPLIFSRTSQQVELVPDLAAIYQSAQKVIVTGARQVEDTNNPTNNPTAPRPKFKKTEEFRPAGTVFSSLAPSTASVLYESKTIIYQYWDDDDWSSYLPLFSTPLTAFLYDIQSQTQTGINPYGVPPVDLNAPMQTITIKQQPIGSVFPAQSPAATLITAEVIVESNLRKMVLKPAGVLFPSLVGDTTLTIDKKESLTSAYIPPGAQITPVVTNPNGGVQEYEARPKLEPLQPKATRPLKTQVLKGESQLTPLGWTPVLAKPLVVDFGFLPDNARADYLAHKIATREQQRRDQVLVDLPIPTEWLANGWPLLSRANIGGDVYLMDGCAISIQDGMAKFGFTGGLVSKGVTVDVGGVPTVVQRPLCQVDFDLIIGLIAEIVIEDLVISSEITIELVTDFEVGDGAIVAGSTIFGTTGADTLVGTAGDDIIYGVGGDDTISGGAGNDNLFAGSQTNPVGGGTTMHGDGGNDILTGGSAVIGETGSATGFNFLDGSNETLMGVGEHDTLIGGGSGSFNYFYLGSTQGSYYVGGDDYASISNFDPNIDVIQLFGSASNYAVSFTNGVCSIYWIGAGGSQDLIAEVVATALLNLTDSYFNYV
jgi:RTX calcium-binding nonapeptide repeat (4 copies)